jgi:transcriptional regulator with PAS, ATPase and Fis domain
VRRQIARSAPTPANVLITGESGVGKELVARAIHAGSARYDRPFVPANCAAIPEALLESQLFGHVKGAFTSASLTSPGLFVVASGGTLFLDEIGELPFPLQVKLVHAIEERQVWPVGATKPVPIDVRLVASTHRDLVQEVRAGRFREDLFYRLNVFAIRLPALRERRDDILPLSEAFLGEIGRGLGRPPAGISRDARQRLVDYHWPGNVRELRNILERAAILCDGGLITSEHLALTPAPPRTAIAPQPAVAEPAPANEANSSDIASVERAMIEEALQKARFNKSKAAKRLGLTRTQLYVRMRRYGLE